MASTQPQLLKQTALAKATQLETRVNLLVASSTTELSPVVVYLDGASTELSVNGATAAAGVWTCPAGLTSLQVECWGAGGGGSGGLLTNGGGGGGGGEYACEPNYAVIAGNSYTYAVGRAGQGGISAGQGGHAGGSTIFDTAVNGVTANGGGGGDGPSNLNGGTGSANTIHYDGGAGGVSSAGVASDNPSVLSNLLMWWVLKEGNSSSGYVSSVYDSSGHSKTGTCYSVEPGPPVKSGMVSTPGIVPPQTPGSNGNCIYFKQDVSNRTNSAISAPAFGLGKGIAAPNDGSKLTVSCWIRADTTLNSWGSIPVYGHQYVVLVGNANIPAGVNSSYSHSDSSGFGLFLQNGQPGFYLNDHTVANSGRVVLGSVLPVNSTWHQLVGTWDGTTMTLYVDGSSTGTATPGFTKFGAGPSAICAGLNPATRTDSVFTGYMSNAWVSASTASSGYVSTAYGASAAAGGSGGGASGGSGGTGNAGTNATSTSGAAAGASAPGTGTQLGSGAGGAGGNQHVNGSNAPSSTPFGGGGGGAGEPASTAAVSTLAVPAIQSAAYCGFDDPEGDGGSLYSISTRPQAGTPNPYPYSSLISSNVYVGGTPSKPINGSMTGMVLFPAIPAQLKGNTINTITLTFTAQSTNASVLPVWMVVAGPGVSQLPATFGSAADITNFTGGIVAPTLQAIIPIPAGAAGRQVTVDLTSTGLATYFSAGNLIALALGGFQGEPTYDLGDGAYNDPDAFEWNSVVTGAGASDQTTDMTLTFELFATAASNKVGGDGAPGSLVLSFIDPRYWPVCAIQPTAAIDENGNTFAAGVTTASVVGFDPTVVTPPLVVETWHSLGSLAGGSGLTMDTARYRYSPEDGGTLVLQVTFFVANGTVITGGNYSFSVTLPTQLRPTCSPTASHDIQVFPALNQNVSGALTATLFAILVNGANSASAGTVTLDVNFSGTASGNSRNTVIARIPLT